MRIREITLFTNQLTEQLHFYKNVLGFQITEEDSKQFTFQAGFSTITFRKSEQKHIYHYCFLIPSNQLEFAIKWLDSRLNIIKIEGDRIIQNFESWNADSVYFYDGVGNIAEFIVRYDLENQTVNKEFDVSTILCLNEIGTPTQDIAITNTFLETEIGSKFWKGDFERFGTNGTQEGLFLLVNNEIKKEWFPTQLSTESSPFYGSFEVEKSLFKLQFRDGKLSKVGK
ncbi:VOC family protein [Bernardetia sp.]|uniref:VOC family protein n=1 Tax=Bernardetia sp. TaxID=1937974 RepID=UPI0025BCF6BF|nr:VOC family protein [Bernardetia sp.]